MRVSFHPEAFREADEAQGVVQGALSVFFRFGDDELLVVAVAHQEPD